MGKERSCEVRDGGEKDLQPILALRKLAFGEMEKDKLDPSFWRWQFLDGPDGRAFIYIAEEGGEVVGHFADIPRSFSLRGEAVCGSLSLDLMVHPDHRRKGIFGRMARYGIERVKAGGGLFMTAYPIRKETIQGLRKVGWKEVVRLPVLVYPIRSTAIVDRYLRIRALSFLIGGVAGAFHSLVLGQRAIESGEASQVEEVRQFDDHFDGFWEKARSLTPIMGVRDRHFLEWRYLKHPTRSYSFFRVMKEDEMRGYIVLAQRELLRFNAAVVVDLLAIDEIAFGLLVQKAIKYGRGQGVDLLAVMVPEKHPYYRNLRRSGFLPSPKTFLYMVYPQSPEAALLDPHQWYVNWGDTDVI
jgi:GNAT superfamily N-acetyltransferase